jgi:hypothetical protein
LTIEDFRQQILHLDVSQIPTEFELIIQTEEEPEEEKEFEEIFYGGRAILVKPSLVKPSLVKPVINENVKVKNLEKYDNIEQFIDIVKRQLNYKPFMLNDDVLEKKNGGNKRKTNKRKTNKR